VLHVVPQLIPEGLLETVPVPVPALCTVSCSGMALNSAVTEALAFRSTAHVPVPLHVPDQPANLEPVLGLAVSVTEAPLAKVAPHVVPQLIPEGLLVTIPFPVPVLCTVSWKVEGADGPQPQRMVNGARLKTMARYLWL
jgi:hypothetical protein